MLANSANISLWEWYGQDEHKRLLAICDAIIALEFLAKNADEQIDLIPDCAACETWYSMVIPLSDALSASGKLLPAPILTQMTTLWDLCNSPESEAAFRCGDRSIFHETAWQPIREQASELLASTLFSEVRPYLESLMDDCREALGLAHLCR
ncbi:hypothetical protein [uncultured Pseudomonas sp.]|uniref:hypothetical protein n=1 Tax=uncultured Pseudomonas sp. TaxID=114707 RepID=UPI0025EE4B54|nr:hypothetical protein [uncultured Pseudomonas sp.]